MSLTILSPILAMGQPTSPSGTQQDPRAQLLQTVGMIVLMVVIFYVVLFRPQQKKQKETAAMLKSIRPGDKVITTGGMVAVVVTVKEKTLAVRSADSKFEITKAAIAEVTERSGSPSES